MNKATELLRNESGQALFWTIVAIASVTITGATVRYIASHDRVVSENFEVDAQAWYAANGAMADYLAQFAPGDQFEALTIPAWDMDQEAASSDSGQGNSGNSGKTSGSWKSMLDEEFETFSGIELSMRNFNYAEADVSVVPKRVAKSPKGDIWLVESRARIMDARKARPGADRAIRVFARMVAPFNPVAAFNAPNGLTTVPGSKHFHVEGKPNKCDGGAGVEAMTAPPGTASVAGAKDQHIKGPDGQNTVIDESYNSANELIDALGVNYTQILNAARSGKHQYYLEIPRDYPDLESADFKNLFPKSVKKSSTWPVVLVEGSTTLTGDVNGFGFLLVNGALVLDGKKLDWKGVVMVGKQLEVRGKTHLHLKGTLITGLACTADELADGSCKNVFDGEHLGVKWQRCEVEAAWAQLMTLRELPGGRHTKVF